MAQYGGGPRTGGQMQMFIEDSVPPETDPAGVGASWYGAGAGGACPIADLTIDDTRNTADLRYRCADVAYGLPAKRNPITADFRLVFGIDATLHALILGMFGNDPAIPAPPLVRLVAFMSEPMATTGSTGLVLPMFCSAYPHDQPLEDVAGHDIVFTMGYMEDVGGNPVQPAWLTVPF